MRGVKLLAACFVVFAILSYDVWVLFGSEFRWSLSNRGRIASKSSTSHMQDDLWRRLNMTSALRYKVPHPRRPIITMQMSSMIPAYQRCNSSSRPHSPPLPHLLPPQPAPPRRAPTHPSLPRLGILVSAEARYLERFSPELSTLQCYAAKKGYALFVEPQQLHRDRHYFFSRQADILKYLPYVQWLMRIDVDGFFADWSRDLEDFLDDRVSLRLPGGFWAPPFPPPPPGPPPPPPL
jgi:hypothetical protein